MEKLVGRTALAVRISPRDLDLTIHTHRQMCERAMERGFTLCPAELSMLLPLQVPSTETVCMGMDPVTTKDGRRIFFAFRFAWPNRGVRVIDARDDDKPMRETEWLFLKRSSPERPR